MATIRQSRAVNMEGWKPVPPPTVQSLPTDDDALRTGRSPYMLSSMPFDASNNDGLQRQFYGGSNSSTIRIFTPVVE